ncbi:MAG: hypothetical protein G8D61_19315 [gamma proteobacterium symbiont of Ctena orbiculata]
MNTRSLIRAPLFALSLLSVPLPVFAELEPVSNQAWNLAAVRHVLHTFAYGGFSSDRQIIRWANMSPQTAIQEMLTFDEINPKLSPIEDSTAQSGPFLTSLQEVWSADDPANPACPSDQLRYSATRTRNDGEVILSNAGLQNTWIAAINKRGLNTFAHHVGFWLVNYQMAVNTRDTEPSLVMSLYDQALDQLRRGEPFHRILANGASSAAVAREYGHRNNRFNNRNGMFIGNDDFAREFHQLFFRINGDTEDTDYHENTTIEHTAWILTGMQLDREPFFNGTTLSHYWWTAPIDFTNHMDASGRNIQNNRQHISDAPEVLHQPITGLTAEDKLFNLAEVAIQHPESLDNLPLAFIEYFADDNLTDNKKDKIRKSWQAVVGNADDFLHFLQAYAISTTFHDASTYKYRTAFSRNLTIYNQNTVDNEESYGNSSTPRNAMARQGAVAFIPVHDVFGNQTSLNAANSQSLFKEAYNNNVNHPNRIAKVREVCRDASGRIVSIWEKDWARLMPTNPSGLYNVKDAGKWLWRRFTSDSGRNFTVLERAQVAALLAAGRDFASLADPANPDRLYTAAQLNTGAAAALLSSLENQTLALNSNSMERRRQANRRVGMAINFITMTPFMFANGGN